MTLESYFQIRARGSTPMTELRAGLTTFVTMAYILPVNVEILSKAGLDSGAVFIATVISAVVGCLMMGLWAKLPFALAPGMGLNAFFAYTAVLTLGLTPAQALGAVFCEGLIFIALSVSGVRTKLMHAIPKPIQLAIAAGIGLFIAFSGLQQAGIIVPNEATQVMMNPNIVGSPALLSFLGMLLTAALWIRGVPGALIVGIFGTWLLGMGVEAAGLMSFEKSLFPSALASLPPSADMSWGLCFEGLAGISDIPTLGKFLVVMLTFLYIDVFDTVGTFTAVMINAGTMDDKGNFPNVNRAFLSDAVATTAGAVFGTSTVTTFVESAAGVKEGGRTGLTAVWVAVAFAAASFLYPVIAAIPSFATAPALVVVGMMMCTAMADFEWKRTEVLVPGIITIVFMITAYSISAGIMWGIIFYIACFLFAGKSKEISPALWALTALFVLKLLFLD